MFFPSVTNERGSSLVQVVIVLVVSAVTNLAIMNLLSDQGRQHRDIFVKTSALAIRQNLVGVMSNHQAWKQTRMNTGSMSCGGSRETSPFCWGDSAVKESRALASLPNQGGKASPEAKGAASPGAPATISLALYDAAGALVHSNAPDAGYTATGEPCTGFSDSGNDDCPLKFDVTWRSVCTSVSCTGSDFTAPEFVSIQVRYSPRSSLSETPFNPLNYGLVEQNRLLFAGQASPALECAMKSRIFVGPGRLVNGMSADGQGCVAYEAFYGPRGERGDRGPQGLIGPAGNDGPPGADAVCP